MFKYFNRWKANIKICGMGNTISFNDYENTFRGEINDFINIFTYNDKNNIDKKQNILNNILKHNILFSYEYTNFLIYI